MLTRVVPPSSISFSMGLNTEIYSSRKAFAMISAVFISDRKSTDKTCEDVSHDYYVYISCFFDCLRMKRTIAVLTKRFWYCVATQCFRHDKPSSGAMFHDKVKILSIFFPPI